MFWLFALAAGSGCYMLVDYFGIYLLVFMIIGPVIGFLYELINGFNESLGLNRLMVHSWQFLSGVNTPHDVVAHCTAEQNAHAGFGNLIMSFVMFIPILVNVVIGLIAIIGLPVGVLSIAIGSAISLASEDKEAEAAKMGALILVFGLSAVVAAGLMMRLIHFGYANFVC